MSARSRSRRGFLLAVVLLVAAVVGVLVLLIQQGVLHRSVQVQLASDRASARFLARGALDCVKFGLTEATLPPPPGVPPSTAGRDLFAHLLSGAAVLALPLPRGTGQDDDRAWLEARLGSGAFVPLDRLVRALPDARVKLTSEFVVVPRPPGPRKDPVVKRVACRLRAAARVRHAEEALSLSMELEVYSELPVAGKFTLAAPGAGGLATSRVTIDGHPLPGSDMPVVLIHHPDDGDPLATDPFAPGVPRPLVPRSVGPSEAVTAHAARGLVFLSGSIEHADVHLPLAAGGAPFGEQHALYAPHDGKPATPGARPLADQPAAMRAFGAPDLVDRNIVQAAFVQGTVVPLEATVDAAILGPHPDPESAGGVMVSRLLVHGTQTMPSATAVVGPAFHTVAAIAAIAVDRDHTDADEIAQAATAGRRLPVRDGKGPYLAFVEEAEFEQDLAAEQSSTEPSYARFRPFGKQGELTNENAFVDADGDGTPETAVASEALFTPLHLDLTFWKYANLFASYAEYRRAMSRYVSLPVNLSLDLAGRPAEQAMELLREAALGRQGTGGWSDWVVRRVSLSHRDALHREPAAGGALFLDGAATGPDGLEAALIPAAWPRYPGERTVTVRGQRQFEERFMPGGVMDLSGLSVTVLPADGETTPGLAFDHPLAVKPGSGGVLDVRRLACPALINGDRGAFSPVVIHADELVLTGRGPFEAVLAADVIRMENVTDFAVIRGSLSTGRIPEKLARPLVVAWDPRLDPTGEAAPLSYRIAIPVSPRVYGSGY